MEGGASQEEARRGRGTGLHLGSAKDNPKGEAGCGRGGPKELERNEFETQEQEEGQNCQRQATITIENRSTTGETSRASGC
jgi:hypothetical protein